MAALVLRAGEDAVFVRGGAPGGAVLLLSEQECKTQVKNMGTFPSNDVLDCLWAAHHDADCPAVVMWSPAYSSYATGWGCRCCPCGFSGCAC